MSEPTPNKEHIYDSEIAPKMTQIIDVCKANGIAMIASFSIPTEADPDLACTTCLFDGSGKNGPHHKEALRIIRDEPSPIHLCTTDKDGNITLTAILP